MKSPKETESLSLLEVYCKCCLIKFYVKFACDAERCTNCGNTDLDYHRDLTAEVIKERFCES